MDNMYAIIQELCKSKGISVAQLARETGISKSTLSELKSGRTNSLSAKNMEKISEYFQVPSDYLLGKAPETGKAGSSPQGEPDFDAFTYAMYEEGKKLTEENKAKLLEMAKFFRQQQEKEKK